MTLIITDKQAAYFDKLAENQFVKELYCYCQTQFPAWTAKMGQENAIEALFQCVQQAKELGFRQRNSLYFYTDISMLLGSHFYRDCQYYWLAKQIDESREWDEKKRISHLYAAIKSYTENVFGEQYTFLEAALDYIAVIEAFHFKGAEFSDEFLAILTKLYPQKINFIGQTVYRDFIKHNQIMAIEKGFNTSNQQAIFIVLSFLLGEQFLSDPIHVWLNWSDVSQFIKEEQFSFKALLLQLIKIWGIKDNH